MKMVVKIVIIVLVFAITGCTKFDFVDTGIADGRHNTTMWEYFHTDSYNWDSLIVMVKHVDASFEAEIKLQELFEGKSKYQNNVTFFGITNHSIRRYMLQKGYKTIMEIPAKNCYDFVLSSVLDEVIMLDGFIPGKPSADVNNVIGVGGKRYHTLSGKMLWIYTFRGDYEGVPDAGPIQIHIVSEDTQKQTNVASSDIVTNSGVVHSLSYDFTPNDF